MPDIRTLYEKALADKAAGKDTDLAIDVYANVLRQEEQQRRDAANRPARRNQEEFAAQEEDWKAERERTAAREERERLQNEALGNEERRRVVLLLPVEFGLRHGWLITPLVIAGLIFKVPTVPREWMVLAAGLTPLLGAIWMWLRAQLTPQSQVISRFHFGWALLYFFSGVLAIGTALAGFDLVGQEFALMALASIFLGGIAFLWAAASYGLR
jgi:hypothetical protein